LSYILRIVFEQAADAVPSRTRVVTATGIAELDALLARCAEARQWSERADGVTRSVRGCTSRIDPAIHSPSALQSAHQTNGQCAP
jgi:hypothetical protein